MTNNFYYFRTINGQQFISTKTYPAHSMGRQGIAELVNMARSTKFDTSNWDDLKAIEYAMLSIATSNGYTLMTSESLFYGKKYIAVSC